MLKAHHFLDILLHFTIIYALEFFISILYVCWKYYK